VDFACIRAPVFFHLRESTVLFWPFCAKITLACAILARQYLSVGDFVN
jgi:hypothetical protein